MASDVRTNAGLSRLTLQNEALASISNNSPSSSPLPLTMDHSKLLGDAWLEDPLLV
jgi:hypothetical protein